MSRSYHGGISRLVSQVKGDKPYPAQPNSTYHDVDAVASDVCLDTIPNASCDVALARSSRIRWSLDGGLTHSSTIEDGPQTTPDTEGSAIDNWESDMTVFVVSFHYFYEFNQDFFFWDKAEKVKKDRSIKGCGSTLTMWHLSGPSSTRSKQRWHSQARHKARTATRRDRPRP